ncbi:hypothetical protein OAF54_00190 [bacterium]|nr:hypothetical protein [bacterium]
MSIDEMLEAIIGGMAREIDLPDLVTKYPSHTLREQQAEATKPSPNGHTVRWDWDTQVNDATIGGYWSEEPIVCEHEWVCSGVPGGQRWCKHCDEDFKGEWND